ncbi:hypothetical protein [Streptomyces sp. NPDC048734]|uniref:hypothetical protein n=1 Tax=Streptomyces sp. NPDC048734 TaxID=3365590 RepID=UPI00371FDEC4
MAGRADGNGAYGHKAFERAETHFAHRTTADGRDGRHPALGIRFLAGAHERRARRHPQKRLGVRPLGDGTPPGPARPGEEVPPQGRP